MGELRRTLFDDTSSLRSANLLNIERLLLIAERYIVSVEELHFPPRSILPHGASFQGQPLNLNVHCESHKTEFMIQVSYLLNIKCFRFLCLFIYCAYQLLNVIDSESEV